MEKIPLERAKIILDGIDKQLNNRFCELRSQTYNPNTKGFDYELVLKGFFESYLGGAFEFLVRVGILDYELKVKSVLKPEQNEFDVVAIYRNAMPKLVLNRMVPYDSIAFIVEAKQTLTTPFLRSDLKKFSKLEELKVNPNRGKRIPDLIDSQGKEVTLKRPLRFLFYYEAKADMKKVNQLLCGELGKFWDICVVLKENTVLLNKTLPFRFRLNEQYDADLNYPLLKAMLFTTYNIEGIYFDSWLVFFNLFKSVARLEHEVKP
jgi:hypothetical protein